ncbi:hypothetical protein [Anoxybacillus flavithermus]|uniref:Uncharacterized protein n=1 Tax=Anoxybacillus flavithermus TaxID=33934 RepID=A0A178TQY9_9BACL|nr:hypothetical protein [Anoxybacillus flavithermus]OAO82611.1 hypothetical protein TAF16_0231 [Anoxybacillus flavithermus]
MNGENQQTVNVSNISAGQIFKNYKELCNALGEPIKTGNAKNAQLKEWSRNFSYERQGHKFIISEIYNTPKEKEDKRSEGHNETPYIHIIEKLIIDLLAQNKNGKVSLSKNLLLKELKMINRNYIHYKNKRYKLSDFTGITKIHIDEFYDVTDGTLTRNLERALKKLENRALIFWERKMKVCFVNVDVEYDENLNIKTRREVNENEYGDEEITYIPTIPYIYTIHREATDEEIRIIKYAEEQILKKYNCEFLTDIYKKGIAEKFFKEVQEIIFNKAHIAYYYQAYEIIYTYKSIENFKEKINDMQLDFEERKELQSNLNNSVSERLVTNAQKRNEQAKEIDLKQIKHRKRWLMALRQNNDYLSNTEKLVNILIKDDNKL